LGFLSLLTATIKQQPFPLPGDCCSLHAEYVRSAQDDEGGFVGRRGRGNPYYTAFGLCALYLLDRLDSATVQRAVTFLEKQPLPAMSSIMDLLALVDSCHLLGQLAASPQLAVLQQRAVDQLLAVLGRLRRDDGGYATGPSAASSSTYLTCLAIAALFAAGEQQPDVRWLASWLKSRQQPDGGFTEAASATRGGTNPTALAVTTLGLLGSLDEQTAAAASRFLCSVLSPDGGFRAHPRAPAADLLSTFTGLVALENLQRRDLVSPQATRRFVLRLQMPAGGFRGGVWDERADVEYTYYGLGSLAILEKHKNHRE